MNRKKLLLILLVLTVLTILVILLFNHKTKYEKLIISENEWNEIISSRNNSSSISIDKIEFNDYSLLIDEESSNIYYSVVDVNNKYNPYVKYSTNEKLSIALNSSIADENLNNNIKMMIYKDTEYRIYNLVVTKYPILNITYGVENEGKRKIDASIYLFDNYINSPMRVLKSDGRLRIVKEGIEYSFSLRKESLGHNERDNYISIFGMPKQNEYTIIKANMINESDRYVELFINNKYQGLYILAHNEERRVDNFERNRGVNK